jgi:hypothetical protein
MQRQFPAKFVGFLLGTAALALLVALYFGAYPLPGINNHAVANVFLWIAFGTCAATLLELAVIYFPGVTGPQSALLILLLILLGIEGWAGRAGFSHWADANHPQQGTAASGSPAHVLSGSFGQLPDAPPPPPTKNRSHSNITLPDIDLPNIELPTIPGPHIQHNENRNTPDTGPPMSKAAINPEPCGSRPSPGCDPPKLPTITLPQRNIIRDAMKPYAGLRFTLLREDPTEDSDQYADQIEAALLDAGLINSIDRNIPANGRNDPAGVSLIVGSKASDAAGRMSSAMHKAGLTRFFPPISQTAQPESFQIIIAPNH